jgi:hypothetical protein
MADQHTTDAVATRGPARPSYDGIGYYSVI